MVIYKITNIENNKIYIGCTVLSIEKRFNAHWWKRNEGDTALKRAFLKYGKASFTIEEVDKCLSREDMLEREKKWIRILDSRNKEIGYNLHIGGACLGRNATIDEKEANRRRNIGKECKAETRLKISIAQKGIPRSKEATRKAALKKMGRKQTPEHIEKCRLKRIGRIVSPETKEKSRISNLGQKRSKDSKIKMSISAKSYHEKYRNKLGEHIVCLNNNKVYFSHNQAAQKLGLGRNGITRVVNGILQTTGGYQFQRLTAEHLIF